MARRPTFPHRRIVTMTFLASWRTLSVEVPSLIPGTNLFKESNIKMPFLGWICGFVEASSYIARVDSVHNIGYDHFVGRYGLP